MSLTTMVNDAFRKGHVLRERRAEHVVRELLEYAGIAVDGPNPWDIQVHDSRFYAQVLNHATLGLGESYMDGMWDAEAVDQTIARMLSARLRERIRENWQLLGQMAVARVVNFQSQARAFEVGKRHYDIGNELYRAMLDSRMVYTCGYWHKAEDLDAAQEAKLDLVCRKINAAPGMRILELGCGWGSFAKFAAENYGAHVVGYTVAKEQVALGMERCAGLPVDLRLADYRDAEGQYDAVVSIGIMEHIGHKNYRAYMDVVDACLAPGGIGFIHTIGDVKSRPLIDEWFHKYIFPNAVLPTLSRLSEAMEDAFVIEDVQNFGPDYDRTLMAWHRNFEEAWPSLRQHYDERFYRMWRFYLLSCAAGFRTRRTQLYQIVFTRTGTPLPDFCRQS